MTEAGRTKRRAPSQPRGEAEDVAKDKAHLGGGME